MTTEQMISSMRKHGYRVSRDMNSGRIVATTPRGFGRSFHSYKEAYKFYFN